MAEQSGLRFVAIDAGGTKTRCWVADESRVLGMAECGTVKLMAVGEAVATERLVGLVRSAAAEAGVVLDAVTCTCMGLAGIGSESVRRWAGATLGGLVSGEVMLVGDETIALEAAFAGGPGVFVIAGTGSNVTGRCAEGTRFGAGGWGPVAGDEGSGGWIGLEAVKAGFRARDRGEAADLLGAVQRFWGLTSLGELIAKVNHIERTNFAELTEVVAGCAADGDAVAADVLRRAGLELAEQVLVVVGKMRDAGCAAADYAEVRFTGSVLGKIDVVREAMVERLRGVLVGVVVPLEEVNAVAGALWLARRQG